MIAVFAGFVLDPNRSVKLFGVGLAGAVFLDAFVLRTILVPSLMHLLGRSNWFFPKVLDRITPRVSVEPADDDVVPPRGTAAGARRSLSQSDWSSRAAPVSRSSRRTRRAYAGVAPASPQAGVGTTVLGEQGRREAERGPEPRGSGRARCRG